MSLLLARQADQFFAALGTTPSLVRSVVRTAQYTAVYAPVLVAAAAPVVQPTVVGDQPRQAVLQQAARPATQPIVGLEQFPPVLRASAVYPDTTRRASLLISEHPSTFRPEALEQITGSWAVDLPDTTRRAAGLPVYQVLFRAEAVEQFIPPALSWGPKLLDWIPRRQYRDVWRHYQHTIRGDEEPFVPSDDPTQAIRWIAFPDTTRRATLPIAEYPTLAHLSAIEQWAVPALSWRGLWPDTTRRATLHPAPMQAAIAYADSALAVSVPPLAWMPLYPESTRRFSLQAAEHPALVRGEALEQLAVPALSWRGWWPDTTRRAVLHQAAMHPAMAFAERDVAVVVPPLAWIGNWPDTTRRAALATCELPAVFRAESVEQFAPTLLWGVTAPDTTRRLALAVGQLPYLARGEAIEQFSVPALSWQARYPDRVWSVRLQPAQMQDPRAFAENALAVFVPPLAWLGAWPDSTRRAALRTSDLPYVFRAESLEQFAPRLLWSSIGPDRVWRAELPVSHRPSTFWTNLEAPPLSWQPQYPPTTRRAALITAQHPFLYRAQSLENFAPRLLWNAFYPDTTRRARDISGAIRATSTTLWANWDPFSVQPTPDVIVMVAADPGIVLVGPDVATVRVPADPAVAQVTSTDFIIVIPPDSGPVKT